MQKAKRSRKEHPASPFVDVRRQPYPPAMVATLLPVWDEGAPEAASMDTDTSSEHETLGFGGLADANGR
jgi:hypothetical protein